MPLEHLGTLLVDQQLQLSSKISHRMNERYTQFLIESRIEDQEIVRWRGKLIEYIGKALISNQPENMWEQLTDWAQQTGAGAAQYNVGIDELMKTIKVYREVIWEFVENQNHAELNFKSFLQINKIIDSFLDQTAYVFSTSYVKQHAKNLSFVRQSMLEISAPIVSVSDNIAVLPLVGEIDTDRAKVLMETVLEKCSELKNTELIIDLSGVPIVDTMVADQLFKIAHSLNLIGVKPTFIGIRPEIAQAVVNLGIDFSNISTIGNLKQALKNRF